MSRKWNPARTVRTDRGLEVAINIGEEMDAATTNMMKTETGRRLSHRPGRPALLSARFEGCGSTTVRARSAAPLLPPK